ncbi:MAG: polysaccharide biosynthesis/export family protein [Tepidisphaeraceae bacterium]
MLRSLIASRKVVRATAAVVLASLSVGCEVKSFLDPSQVGRFEKDAKVVPILDSLNLGTDEVDTQFVTARDVKPEDLVESKLDYTIGANDTVQVTVNDLYGAGTETTKTLRVSASGKISLPLLPAQVKADGLSEQQLERAVADAYKDAGILTNPNISVAVVEARGRTYNISGAVGSPGPYAVFDTDYRLLNAIIAARDVTSAVGIDYVYVIRKKDAAVATTSTGATTQPTTAPGGADVLAPQSSAKPVRDPSRSSQMLQTGQAPAGSVVVIDGKEVTTPVPAATNPVTDPTTGSPAAPAFAFKAPEEPTDREVIRVPYNKLKQGELKYNIVVRPSDLIYVAQPVIGEYYIGGNVQAPGAYSLNARKITLKEAVTAARGLNEVAWPSRTDVVRRLPGDKEVYVRVDLDKIFSGQDPDMYLKPDDHVIVGTNAIAPFLGALRNGFRLTYGFGFLYDRNYAPDRNNN